MGVPTVGGECGFDPAYDGNILVNAMCVGLARADRIFYSAAAGPGNAVVYVGAKTGRDGIHGATMASAEFGGDAPEAVGEKRPTVQVGDPFTEKLLIEACLELMQGDAVVAIQDMGAAGLTSSAVEMAGKGGLGIELDLDKVPVREAGMTPYEIMLSESQERMLMVLRPGGEAEARRIFEKWELDFAVIGHVTDSGHLALRMNGETMAEIPVGPLVGEAPVYERPWRRADPEPEIDPASLPERDPIACLERLIGSPALASRRWIWEQYDHLVMGNTVKRPGGDAAVIRSAKTPPTTAACASPIWPCSTRSPAKAKTIDEKIDGYTEAQRYFLSFAQVWCQNQTEPSARQSALTDPHSPGRWRTNGSVQNFDEFGKAFGCTKGQPMYPVNSCRVW